MSTVTFSNGKSVDFNGTPTPADIEEVSSQFGGTDSSGVSTSSTQLPPTSGEVTPWAPSSSTDSPDVAGEKSLANVIPSSLNLIGNVATAIGHPIKTAEGIGNAFAGGIEEGWNALTGGKSNNQQTQTFDALKQSFINSYGSLEAAQKTATNDPMKFGSDVMAILQGGALLGDKMLGTTGVDIATNEAASNVKNFPQTGLNVMPKVGSGMLSRALDTSISKVGGAVISGTKTIASLPIKFAGQVEGLETGVGYTPLKEGLTAASQGGEAMKSFTEALRGNTSPEQLVGYAKSALGSVIQDRSATYQKMLGTLDKSDLSINMAPLKIQLNKLLDDFNITRNDDGTLNFDESTMGKSSDQKAIEDMTQTVDRWKTNTPRGIDILKQRLSNYWEPGSKTGAFSEGLRSTTRDLLNNTPGYTDAMKNYSEMSDNIENIQKSLSLGDNAMVETSFRKLTNALKNNDFRTEVIRGLDADTGGQLMAKIAGQRMSSIVPRGLAGVVEGGIGGVSAIMHMGLLPLLGIAVTTSPRIVGEVIRLLGIGAQGTNYLTSLLSKFTPATKGISLGLGPLQALDSTNQTGQEVSPQ